MSFAVKCPRGHAWEEAAALPGAVATCPVCGMTVPLPGEYAASVSSLTPTLMQQGPWQPTTLLSADTPPTLPDFEIVGELGRGGMGIVYKAKWRPQRNRLVALKVIRKDRLTRDEAVRRFRREAQAAARLDHPNIVQVFDSDHTGDTHYLVMEWVDGVTLERHVEDRGPLPIETACDYMRQAALALQHAHEQALVHRDVKPSNLMVIAADDGALPTVKILDMGVARVLQLGGAQPGESLSTLTQGGAVIGTADYVAPEQLENPHTADIRADLYSLGCTFYFLLTGQVPFPGGTLISKLDKQRWKTPPSVDEARLDVPAALSAVVRKLLAKDPAERYQTPAELARALEEMARTGYSGAGAPTRVIAVLHRHEAHPGGAYALAQTPDGGRILTGGKDHMLHLWDVAGKRDVRGFPKQVQEIRALAFNAKGDRFACATGFSLRLWDLAGQEQRRFSGHTGAVRAVAFMPDGQRVVSAAEDKTVRLWDIQAGREVVRLARHTGGVTCFALTADGGQLLSGSRDQTLRLWDLRTGQEVRVFEPSAGPILAMALTRDGRLAISAHFDTRLRLWDVRTGREIRRYPGHKQMVTAVALTPDGRHFLSGSQDHTVRLWDVDTGCELASLDAHAGGVTALAAAVDGRHAYSIGGDGAVCVLELPLLEKAAKAKTFHASGEHI